MKLVSPLVVKLLRPALLAAMVIGLAGQSLQAETEEAPPAPAPKFTELDQIVDLIPQPAVLKLRGGGTDELTRSAVNERLTTEAVEKTASFKVKVESWDKYDGAATNPHKYRVTCDDETIRIGSTPILVRVTAMLTEEAKPALEKIRRGGHVTLSGTIQVADLSVVGKNLRLRLTLLQGKVEGR